MTYGYRISFLFRFLMVEVTYPDCVVEFPYGYVSELLVLFLEKPLNPSVWRIGIPVNITPAECLGRPKVPPHRVEILDPVFMTGFGIAKIRVVHRILVLPLRCCRLFFGKLSECLPQHGVK